MSDIAKTCTKTRGSHWCDNDDDSCEDNDGDGGDDNDDGVGGDDDDGSGDPDAFVLSWCHPLPYILQLIPGFWLHKTFPPQNPVQDLFGKRKVYKYTQSNS